MPSRVSRLKERFLGGVKIGPSGSPGTHISNMLSGSIAFTAGSAVAGSPVSATIAVANLTGCHMFIGTLEGLTACFALAGVCPGAGSASLLLANWSSSTAASVSGKLRYIAMRPKQ